LGLDNFPKPYPCTVLEKASKLTLSFNVNSHNTLSITLYVEREDKQRSFGILSFGGRGYRKQLFYKLLSRINFRFQEKGRFSAYMVAHVDSKLVDILEALEKVERITKPKAERWANMDLDELHEELTPVLIASKLSKPR